MLVWPRLWCWSPPSRRGLGASPAFRSHQPTGRIEAPSYSSKLDGGLGGFGGFCSSSASRCRPFGVMMASRLPLITKTSPASSSALAISRSSSDRRVALPSFASLSRSCRSQSISVVTLPLEVRASSAQSHRDSSGVRAHWRERTVPRCAALSRPFLMLRAWAETSRCWPLRREARSKSLIALLRAQRQRCEHSAVCLDRSA